METLLRHIRETSGRPTLTECGHFIRSLCGGCLKVAYCGQDCQTRHWQKDHQYECIGAGTKKEKEEELVVDLTQLKDLWGIIQPWLSAEDLKNLRLASVEIERQIRRTYFQHFRVRLTRQSLAMFRSEIAPFIAKVDDSQSGGRLAHFVSQYQRNQTLKDVRISNNPDIDWAHLIDIHHLERLNLSNNRLTNLPESFGNLVNLTTLELYNNQLTNLPESFGNLVNLTYLVLGRNRLTNLPESFGNLVNLTELSLDRNYRLTNLPESFGNLVNLTELSLKETQLTNLSESFGNLVNLTELILYSNQLTNLPESFGNLVNLTWLSLSRNQLTNLPESFGNLVNLTTLFLNENQLTNLPESFGNLVNLTDLFLKENQLTNAGKERLRKRFGDIVRL